MRKFAGLCLGILLLAWASTALANQFTGVWKAGDQTEQWVVQFNADGTFTRQVTKQGQVYNESGRYQIQGQKMYVQVQGEKEGYYLQFRFIDRNTLELYEDGQILARMIRQGGGGGGGGTQPPATVDREKVNELGRTAMQLAKEHKYAEAIPYLRQLVQLDPSSGPGYELMAMCYRGLKRYQEALTAYNRAVQLRPNTANTFYGRALTLRDLGKIRQALADAEKAVQLDPQDGYYRKLRDQLKSRLADSGSSSSQGTQPSGSGKIRVTTPDGQVRYIDPNDPTAIRRLLKGE